MFNVLLLRRLNPPIPVKEQLLQCSWRYFKLACIYGSRWSETKPAKILRYSLFFVQALYLVVIMLLWSVAAYMESDSLSSLIGNTINCLIIQLAFVMFVHFFLNSDAYYRLNDMLTNDLNFQFEHRTTTIDLYPWPRVMKVSRFLTNAHFSLYKSSCRATQNKYTNDSVYTDCIGTGTITAIYHI